MNDLELGVIGNCAVSALIDRDGSVVWYCLPRFDGDPVFHKLLGAPIDAPEAGVFAIELENYVQSNQRYVANTVVLETELHGKEGSIRVTDFIPRFLWRDRIFHPQTLVRRLTPISGSPRIRIRVRPRFEFGATTPVLTYGSHHIRYVGPNTTLRLTTNAPVDFVRDETFFNLLGPIECILGPDETLSEGIEQTAAEFEEFTRSYWRH